MSRSTVIRFAALAAMIQLSATTALFAQGTTAATVVPATRVSTTSSTTNAAATTTTSRSSRKTADVAMPPELTNAIHTMSFDRSSEALFEAAKAQQRAMQPGGGGVKDAPLPVPTPVGNTAPRAGSLDEVTTAIANLDVAARRPDGRAFAQDCFKLADALTAYAPFANSVRQIGPLNAVATQTMMLCERETVGAPPLNECLDLRQRIQNALIGDP